MNTELIHQYEQGGASLAKAIEGLSPAQLSAHPADGTWSIQQIVIHLMESDAIAIDRMKRIIAEDRPLLLGYDESKFAQRLFPDEQPAADAVAVFGLSRSLFARVLRKLDAADWERDGVHNQSGLVTLAAMLENYIKHLDRHLSFIRDKRRLVAGPVG